MCSRGHTIDSLIEPNMGRAEPIPERCGKCGAVALIDCPNCSERLQGISRGVVAWDFTPAEFCRKCGHPLPWASRDSLALHIENMLDEQGDLDPGERRRLEEELASLRDEPGATPGH